VSTAGPTGPEDPTASREPPPADRATILWRARRAILTLTLGAGLLAYGISRFVISPTYSAVATIVINVPSTSGGVSDAITAANDLAAQYAQLIDQQPVLALAAGKLPGGGSGLSKAISAGVVAAQNLVEVSALAGSSALAQRRANEVARAFVTYITGVNTAQAGQLVGSVPARLLANQRAISSVQAAIVRARSEILVGTPTGASVAKSVIATEQSLLATLVNQRRAIVAAFAEGPLTPQPVVTVAAPAGPGTQVEPKPVLYALIAAVAVGLAAGQLFVVAALRRA